MKYVAEKHGIVCRLLSCFGVFLLLLVMAARPAAAQTYTSGLGNTVTSTFNNDGGFFGWEQRDVTVTHTIVASRQPAAVVYFDLLLIEIDSAFDDTLGTTKFCIPPRQWTLRADGRFEITLTWGFPRISTLYGTDWVGRFQVSADTPYSISTTLEQLTQDDPLEQVLTVEAIDVPIVGVDYGAFSVDLSLDPVAPLSARSLGFEPQEGTLPYIVRLANGAEESGVLTGLPTEDEDDDDDEDHDEDDEGEDDGDDDEEEDNNED